MHCHTNNSEIVQIFLEAHMEFALKKAWDFHKNIYVVKGTFVQSCENSSDLQLVSGASLHMMRNNELTSGEEDTISRSKEPTVITTAGGKAEPTEEVAVYVNDLDVFVTKMLLEDWQVVRSWDGIKDEQR